jgi:hypothetical protein
MRLAYAVVTMSAITAVICSGGTNKQKLPDRAGATALPDPASLTRAIPQRTLLTLSLR